MYQSVAISADNSLVNDSIQARNGSHLGIHEDDSTRLNQIKKTSAQKQVK